MNIQIVSHTTEPSESVARLITALELKQPLQLHYGKGINKIKQYQFFTDNNIPALEWTEKFLVAQEWYDSGHTVMARTKIKGQTGSGIFVVNHETEPGGMLEAKVYTKYISHKREFRVNLFKHKMVNVREKKRKLGAKGDFHIRNLENGYTTTKCNDYPEQIVALVEAASKCSESDFIGVDIGYNEAKDFAFIIEVNSGPSIEGSSVQDFVNVIKETYAD